ncbi:MAG: HD domain-containing protein [Sulfurovaceae bacterium]|nr:HD domain-containing protein [Sulfurovaceae bacterium]
MDKAKEQIEELLYNNATSFEIAKVIKKNLDSYFGTLEKRFQKSSGKDFLVQHTKHIDGILQIIYQASMREAFDSYMPMKHSIPIALIALGSYGREQLCVYSDIDLMIVYEEIEGYNIKFLIEKMLYILWDTGIKLGHRVHTTKELLEVSKTDITIKTALLESRFIEGSKSIWTETQNILNAIRHDNPEEFIRLKIEEQKAKHLSFPLTMEPNIKDGVGGFRDANLVYWIGKVLYNTDNIKQLPSYIVDENEYRIFRIALEFLFRVRAALHLISHKKEDRLRLELIPRVALLLGYKHGSKEQIKFAKKVTQSLRIIDLYCSLWIYEMSKTKVRLEDKSWLLPPDETNMSLSALLKFLIANAAADFTANPLLIGALVRCKQPSSLSKTILENIKKIFYTANAYPIIRSLSQARLLGFLLPPFKKVIDLPQFDGYHHYVVDIHSINALYHLENIKDDNIKSLFDELNNDEKALLKLVALLHDTGKGRQKDHSVIGALLFKSFTQKLDFQENMIKLGELLILHHTLMSNVAQREDLHNEKTILDFVSHLKNKKAIDMLYILTYADINGVGNGVYSSFTSKLLKTLYDNAIEALEHTELIDETAKRIKKIQALQKNPEFLSLNKTEQKKILSIPANLPFLRYSSESIVALSKKAFGTERYRYWIHNEEYLSLEIVRQIPINLGYLLGRLSYLEIGNMEISKLFDDLKYFKIDYTTKVTDEDIILINEIIMLSFDPSLQTVIKKPEILSSEIDINCEHSQHYASMYLHTKNQKGLLAYIIDIFDNLNIDIASAKIHTIKNRTRDMFLIEKNGNFCHNIKLIIQKLTENV